MLRSGVKPQLLRVLGALLFGGQAIRAIQLDLTNDSKHSPSISALQILSDGIHCLAESLADVTPNLLRLNQASCEQMCLRNDDILSRQPYGNASWTFATSILLVGSGSYVWTDDRILVLYWRYYLQ